MSFPSKRELLVQVAPRYREAGNQEKATILDQFVAATGYAREVRHSRAPPAHASGQQGDQTTSRAPLCHRGAGSSAGALGIVIAVQGGNLRLEGHRPKSGGARRPDRAPLLR